MHYEVRGDGPPLLFAHGLMGSIANGPLMGDPSDLLSGAFRVINYDARGHGESTHTDDPLDYTWGALAGDMYALLCHLGINKSFVGGGSMGAGTSLVFQRLHPEMVEKLVLLAPPPLEDESMTPVSSAFNASSI
jgi:pimeloyl-ACP methyl ester carboxylesterase